MDLDLACRSVFHQNEFPKALPLSDLALLLLSRPVASVLLGDEDATVLEFFVQYWVLEVGEARTGFFDSEDEAVRYLQSQMSVTEEGGRGNE